MKPEFTQVCLSDKYPVPPKAPPPQAMLIRTVSTAWHLWSTVLFLVIVIIGFGVTVWHYDAKLTQYDERISALESDLSLFLKQLEIQDSNRMDDEGTPKEFVMPIHSRDEDTVMVDEDGSYYDEDDEDEVGLPLLSDEGDGDDEEGVDLEEEDEKEVEEIVFGKISAGSRRKRSSETVSIIEGSYGAGATDKEVTTESEGLRLYESLIATGGKGEPKAPEFAESEGSNVQAYHRSSAAWVEDTGTRGRRRLEVKSGDQARFGETPMYTRTTSPYSQHYSGSVASRRTSLTSTDTSTTEHGPNLIVRNSRVPSTGDMTFTRNRQTSTYPYPPLRKIGQGDGEVIARVHQERHDEESDPDEATAGAGHGESSAFAVSRSFNGGYSSSSERDPRRVRVRPHRKGQLNPDAEELNIVQAEAWAEGPKTVAGHYFADSSNYSVTHRHYEGNGRLRNADGVYSSWRPASWMSESEGARNLVLSPTGVVTVKKGGLYWVYAQVHYLDSHDINGFVLQINTEPLLTCTRMTETVPGSTPKSNSCFTAGIHLFKENDRVLIRDIETSRFSILRPEKTFFGLMRIGDLGQR